MELLKPSGLVSLYVSLSVCLPVPPFQLRLCVGVDTFHSVGVNTFHSVGVDTFHSVGVNTFPFFPCISFF